MSVAPSTVRMSVLLNPCSCRQEQAACQEVEAQLSPWWVLSRGISSSWWHSRVSQWGWVPQDEAPGNSHQPGYYELHQGGYNDPDESLKPDLLQLSQGKRHRWEILDILSSRLVPDCVISKDISGGPTSVGSHWLHEIEERYAFQ
jgi:hypothetical protein